jgi:hydrogenase maturation protein HypF
VVGIALDGLGWGDDGMLWGGEVLLLDYRRCERLASLAAVAMPGGAAAAREPWRNLYAQLARLDEWPMLRRRFATLPIMQQLAAKPLATLDGMIAGAINSAPASSCGRLFDAVAAVLGLCFDRQAYEGEAAMRLEALAATAWRSADGYPFAVFPPAAPQNSLMPRPDPGIQDRDPTRLAACGQETPAHGASGLSLIDPAPLWPALLRDIAAGHPPEAIAARFHHGLAAAVADAAVRSARAHGVDTVALSGGSLQNALLLVELGRHLEAAGLTVLSHARVPANDGGIALGQAAVAAARMIGG